MGTWCSGITFASHAKCVYVYICMYVCIYIYIGRERERERCTSTYIYIYIHMYIYIYMINKWNDTEKISMAPAQKDDTHKSRSAKTESRAPDFCN